MKSPHGVSVRSPNRDSTPNKYRTLRRGPSRVVLLGLVCSHAPSLDNMPSGNVIRT